MAIGATALVTGPGVAGALAPLRREVQPVSTPPLRQAPSLAPAERIVQGDVLPRSAGRRPTTHEYLFARPVVHSEPGVSAARQALNLYARVQATPRTGRGHCLDDHA